MSTVTKSVSAENTWSDALEVLNDFDLSISGTFVGTVTVQRSFDGGSVWRDVDTFTSPIETSGFQPSFSNYRVGIASGGYTSGTAVVTLIDNNLSQR